MNYIILMESIVKIIFLICVVVLPIVLVWFQTRRKINESKDRTQIVMAALEKNPNLDVEELVKKMAPTQKKTLLKEKLLTKLLWGGIFTIFGVGIYIAVLIYNIVVGDFDKNMFVGLSFAAVPSLGVGIAFLVNYFVGKKMLAKEIEAEQKKLLEQE